MHFSQIITAALALPALSFAAAIPERRQNVDCAQYRTLSVGAMTITNNNEREGDVSLQVRPVGGDWFQIAVAKKGQSAMAVNIFGDGSGTKNLRVCSSSYCYYPAGNSPDKQWNMLRSGDRWNFALTTLDGSDDGQVQALCGVGAKVVDGQSSAPAPTTSTTSVAPPTTTTSKTSTTTKNDNKTTATDKTSTKTSTTKISTKTSSSTSKATSTSTRKN